jgi:hypothetical protein
MACGATHHVAVLVAVAGGCLALVGWSAALTWRSQWTEALEAEIRLRQAEGKVERRKRWRGMVFPWHPLSCWSSLSAPSTCR